jgi:pimeloyl-ACP methyl ester carboxylesterase
MQWLARVFPGRGYTFAYDWRKSPEEALGALDRFIDQLREKHGGEKVSIVTHSNGGLLTRWYIDDPQRAQKVAAVADYGTPFWGTPKPWWTVAFGVELPTLLEPGPDPLVPNAVLKLFARNLAGLYYLFPSEAWYSNAGALHSRWLHIGTIPQTRAQFLKYLKDWGGNTTLMQKAWDGHREHIAGFKTNGVDFRVLVGTGLPTVATAQHLLPPPAPSAFMWEEGRFAFTNGDGTVAMFSQRQAGPNGVVMGEQVPTYYFCGIGHMGEPENPLLQQRVQEFLARGGAGSGVDIPYDVKGAPATEEGQLSDQPCRLTANKFELIRAAGEPKSDIPLSVALALETEGIIPKRIGGTATAKLTLAEAERRGFVQVTNVGRRMLITTLVPNKMTLTVKGRKFALRTAALTDEGTKGEVTYGPLSGSVTVAGAAGSKIQAKQGKRTLKPAKRDRKPPKVSVKVTRRGKTATLTFKASDPSGIGAFYVTNAGQPVAVKKGVARVPVKSLSKVRFSAVDLFGNATKSLKPPKR